VVIVTRTVTITRDTHTITATGTDTERLDISVDTSLYGTVKATRSTYSSLIGEVDLGITPKYYVKIDRGMPREEDPFPIDMPHTIGNMASRLGNTDTPRYDTDSDPDFIYLSHLFVQEDARGMGYGLLMWDCALAVAAFGGIDMTGLVGAGGGASVSFLERQGVPPDAVRDAGRNVWGLSDRNVYWEADLADVLAGAPVVVSGGS